MMFRIAPASLAVLAIFNVASTLANGDFKVDFDLIPVGAVISDPRFVYGGSGCGGSNAKCYCQVPSVGPNAGELQMVGAGSDATATGLDFSCTFLVREPNSPLGSAVQCSVHVDLPHSILSDNHLSCTCPGYGIAGCDIPHGGHNFRNVMVLKPLSLQLPPWLDSLQLDDQGSGMADSPTTCEADLAQCNVDKSLNAASVLSKLGEGTIKVVFD